ncbi:MAG: PAS domain-containing protein [Burkholderiaceae bacterium]
MNFSRACEARCARALQYGAQRSTMNLSIPVDPAHVNTRACLFCPGLPCKPVPAPVSAPGPSMPDTSHPAVAASLLELTERQSFKGPWGRVREWMTKRLTRDALLRTREAMQSRIEADHRFDLLFQASGDGLVLCDVDGMVLGCNTAATLLCGEDAASLVGTKLSERFVRAGDDAGGRPRLPPGRAKNC